jgi:hypothetical protein
MRFLKALFSRWANWLGQLLRGQLAEHKDKTPVATRELTSSELVARFIYSQRQMIKSQGRPKPAVFEPPKDDKLSVVHSTGLSDSEVWDIGRLHALVNQPGRDKICGRADLPVKVLIDRKLRAIRDDNPFQRHTSVIGWPESTDPDLRKQERVGICLELSQDPDVRLVIPVSPIIRFV